MLDVVAAEEWRGVVGFPSYEVSEGGSVRRAVPSRTHPAHYVLKPRCNRFGYLSVTLWANGRRAEVFVHRVVAVAFHGPQPTPAHEVAHRDGCKKNNRTHNLRWSTRSDNCKEKRLLGELPDIRGAKHPHARLTEPMVIAMRQRREEGAYYRQIAEEFGVPKLTAYDAVVGTTWSHI
jgi:hypothetical protein